MLHHLLSCGLLLPASSADAPTRAEHTLARQALHAGGTTHSSGADYELAVTLGQIAPGHAAAGGYLLEGGFLRPFGERADALFQNSFQGV